MHKNLFWQAFVLVVLLVNIGYSGVAIYRYYSYIRLTAETNQLTSMNWEIHEHSEVDYTIEAHYVFMVEQHAYEGSTAWPNEHYLNRWAAEYAIKNFSAKAWEVWYDADNPSHSSLKKDFPFKECISALVLWALFLYFLWLGYYVARFKT